MGVKNEFVCVCISIFDYTLPHIKDGLYEYKHVSARLCITTTLMRCGRNNCLYIVLLLFIAKYIKFVHYFNHYMPLLVGGCRLKRMIGRDRKWLGK